MVKPRTARTLIIAGATLLALAPTRAWAHDALGGDELAVANWMLVGAILTIVMGLLAGVWAWRNGQFNSVEASKYTMLELSDDYDKIIAEVDEAERLARLEARKSQADTQTLSTGGTHVLPK